MAGSCDRISGSSDHLAVIENPPYPNDRYRPRFHFTPPAQWANDPNGLVYYAGIYHLFYQFYPDSNVWGPMHWGHALSRDLIHWEHLPVALFPDSLGYIFSGSAVTDLRNTSGLGTLSNPPLVAIFTYHDPIGERSGKNDFQTQGLAFSTDKGNTWKKYSENPVLKNPGIRDFRDPKIFWHEQTNQWIMTLAMHDRVGFYSSPDLIRWTFESDFGKNIGAHGGVWECPDLFSLPDPQTGENRWVLLVSINPGGPNGGSATQYFTGDFDGHRFMPLDSMLRWIDYGPDNYAGVTWSGTAGRKIFLGWMSNWLYADKVPTQAWRGAMTLPRELKLIQKADEYLVASTPVQEYEVLKSNRWGLQHKEVSNSLVLDSIFKDLKSFEIDLKTDGSPAFSIIFTNEHGDQLIVGYESVDRRFYIDRVHSGMTDFYPEFAGISYAPRISEANDLDLKIFMDAASIELFADQGLSVMTQIFFPHMGFHQVEFSPVDKVTLDDLSVFEIRSIYP